MSSDSAPAGAACVQQQQQMRSSTTSSSSNNSADTNKHGATRPPTQQQRRVTIVHGNVVTPREVLYGGHVIVVDAHIAAVRESTAAVPTRTQLARSLGCACDDDVLVETVRGGFVLPGFVDIHNHGLGGHDDVIGHWTNPAYSLRELARCGTLTTLASIIFSADHEQLVQQCIAAVEAAVCPAASAAPADGDSSSSSNDSDKDEHVTNVSSTAPPTMTTTRLRDCCLLGGIHAEGPVLNDRGGLPSCNARLGAGGFRALCASMPSLKVMTVSPHADAAGDFACIRHLLDIGVRPALGHDRAATKTEIVDALRLARRDDERLHMTHVFNVMTFHHRNASLINVALCGRLPHAPRYAGARPPTVEVIADLVHADATTVQALLCSRAVGDVAVITDCISEHRPGKRVTYNGRDSVVRAEGACYLCDDLGRPSATLAGSTSMLADLFYNLISLFRLDLVAACQHVATVPARIARLHGVGALARGKVANVLLLNAECNTIERRMVAGEWTSHAPYRMLRPSTSHM